MSYQHTFEPPEFLSSLLPQPLSSLPTRPHVTLTYAQSLDGCIAGVNGKQLILSGKESMVMTHWLRTMHDGILVGIGTALNDDPQLNARYLPVRDKPYLIPRPIILDSNLRLSPSCKLLKNYQQNRGRRPWVICSDLPSLDKQVKKLLLEQAGAKIIEMPATDNHPDLDNLLSVLHEMGISSLMVEGGQRVISSFLGHANRIIDILVVTVAPVLVGAAGTGVFSQESTKVPQLDHIRSQQFGQDTVMACRCLPSMG